MSNILAIATTTKSLQRLLQTTVEQTVQGVEITIGQPKSSIEGVQTPEINICLCQTLLNPAYCNFALPTKNNNKQWLKKPQAALDLHYLFSFYGNEQQIIPQRLLSNLVMVLNEQSILSSDFIQQTVDQVPYLVTSDLAQQKEKIKLTPQAYSLEDTAKLWSIFFQTPYVLSVDYYASVVLIDSDVELYSAPRVQKQNINTLALGTSATDAVDKKVGIAPRNKPNSSSFIGD